MDYDFYECADLIDELEELKLKHQEDIKRAERLQGVLLTLWCGSLGL